MTNNFVITGPPCAGKSSTINHLSAVGYQTVPETARMEIEHRKITEDINCDSEELVATKELQDEIVSRRIYAEESNYIYTDEVTVLDRSLIDNIAYRKLLDVEIDSITSRFDLENRYDKVFYFQPIDYEQDNIRFENEETQYEIASYIKSTYSEFGYNFQDVVVCPPDERADIVSSEIVNYVMQNV